MRDYSNENRNEISALTVENIIKYYCSLEKGCKLTVSEVANNIGFSERTIRAFINATDTEKDVNGDFSTLYKLVMLHTVFKKNTLNYVNQQEYFKKLKRENFVRSVLEAQAKKRENNAIKK